MTTETSDETIALPEWRNPIFNQRGGIDVEILLGSRWLPFTADSADPLEHGRLLYAALVEAGGIAPAPPLDPAELQADILAATQARLDDFARTRNYDGILSAASYAGSTDAQFAAEGTYAVSLRDATWRTLYGLLAEVQSGARPTPSGYAEIEPLLPTPTWPEETL